ncbi:hypothetical protein H0H92_010409 [Tricholoma furcatifolium]|nr:hypothetical protein H0H92_010409 [Tricholoma furcatifolium]
MAGFTPVVTETSSNTQKFKGKAFIAGPKWTHLPIVTIGLLGVQIFWSVEMGYASPYLLSLGLSKSAMSMVFLAGPLSGLFMQPIIGILADSSTSRFGRRRPFMMIGTIICILSMLLLGYTRNVATMFTTRNSPSNNTLTIILAVLAIYLIDFSINAVTAMDRALVVDTLPPAAQASGNAWAARMLGIGSVVGFFVGTIPLPSMFPFLGTTELEVLSVIVSVLLLAGHTVMAIFVKERILLKDHTANATEKRPNAVIREVRELWSNLLTLPPVIRQICVIQFFAWIAWFPILFYTTIYIGDLYRRSTPISASTTIDERNAEATRLGTRALFYSSVLSLFLNIILPAFVATSTKRARTQQQRTSSSSGKGIWSWFQIPERMKVKLATLWAMSHLVLAGCMLSTLFTDSVFGATILMSITGFSWAITQWAPFSLLAEAILTTPDSTSNARNSILLTDARTPVVEDPEAAAETAVFLPHSGKHGADSSDDESDFGDDELLGATAVPDMNGSSSMLDNPRARVSRLHLNHADEDVDLEDVASESDPNSLQNGHGGGGLSAKAGIILGIHNVFIVVPQFLVTGLSAVIFAIFDPIQPQGHIAPPPSQPIPTSSTGSASNSTEAVVSLLVREIAESLTREEMDKRGGQSNSVVYIFRLGGVSALIAFILCWRLARELRHR